MRVLRDPLPTPPPLLERAEPDHFTRHPRLECGVGARVNGALHELRDVLSWPAAAGADARRGGEKMVPASNTTSTPIAEKLKQYRVLSSLIMSTCISGVAGYLESLILSKRSTLVGGALGH